MFNIVSFNFLNQNASLYLLRFIRPTFLHLLDCCDAYTNCIQFINARIAARNQTSFGGIIWPFYLQTEFLSFAFHLKQLIIPGFAAYKLCGIIKGFLPQGSEPLVMVTHTVHMARTAIGIIGNFISFFLFASPMPTLWRILKKKSSEEFHPYPYIASVMSCVFWVFYGLPIVHPNSILVVTINSVGLVMELSYLTIFFIYTHKKYRIHIVGLLVAVMILFTIVAVITLELCHTHERRSMLVGIVCVVFVVIMYASPLSIMKKVIETKSVEFMPLSLSWASFANGVVWTVYALLEFDIYLLIGNATGAISGAAQLILYAYYYKRKLPGGGEGDAVKQNGVELETKLPA